MTLNPIEIVPYQKEDNEQVRELLVHAFHGKFHSLVNLNDNGIVKLLGGIWTDDLQASSVKQIVAKENGEIVGTLCLKWKETQQPMKESSNIRYKQLCQQFGTLNVSKFIIGMQFLAYKPRARECYVDHIAIKSSHRNKGIGRQLLSWAQHFAALSGFEQLSLYVAGKNNQAIHLYEKMAFSLESSRYNLLRGFIFQEPVWHFMTWKTNHLQPRSETIEKRN